jgi:hypothetical protein
MLCLPYEVRIILKYIETVLHIGIIDAEQQLRLMPRVHTNKAVSETTNR